MMLDAEVASLDAVPEPLHDCYVQGEDGRYRLQVVGVVPEAEAASRRAGADGRVRELEALVAERDRRLETLAVDAALHAAAGAGRVRAAALPDLLNRGRSLFHLVDGQVVGTPAADGPGLTPAAWIDALRGEAPHLFEESSGGGALGGGAGDPATRVIGWGDQTAINGNLADIATGRVVLRE